jgi:predicted small lipoprotein YifL
MPHLLSRLPVVLTLLAAAAAVGACGQSGPLYLPGNPSEVQSPLPASPPGGDEEENDEEPAERDR